MEQSPQNGASYPPPFLHQSSPFFYAPPPAPSSATQGFHTTESVQGLDYGKPHEDRDTCDIMTFSASDSMPATNADNFFQALEGLSKRLSRLEDIVQGFECSIEGLQRAVKEKHTENNDKLARVELLIKEVLTGVRRLNESQNLDGAMCHMRKLQVDDKKAPIGEEMQRPSMERERHPNELHSYLEPADTSEQLTQGVPRSPLSTHYSEAPPPPQLQKYAAPHNMSPTPPSTNEPAKPTIQHPYPPPLPSLAPLPLSNGQLLPPHNSMQVPPFPYQAQAHVSLSPPPPQGLSNLPMEVTSYGPMQLHQQYTEPPRALSNSSPKLPQNYGEGARQEVPHSSPQYGYSGSHVYERAAGIVGATPVFVPPYVQPWPPSPPASMYESTNGITGYNNGPSYRAAEPVSSTTRGGGSHSSLSEVQPLHSTLPAASVMPVGSLSTNCHQINNVTEKVVAMGFSREQVRAVVQSLTDIGQPVDMNAVLDRLMNRGELPQPQRGWYKRG